MNRNRSFSKPEMEELESHLWEEMDEMVATDGCSEEEAFHKVVANLGNRTMLDSEYKKTKKISISRINSWAHAYLWQIVASFLGIIILIISDSIYAGIHLTEKIDVIDSNVYPSAINGEDRLHKFNFYFEGINALSKGIIYNYDPVLSNIMFNFIYDDQNNLWISKTNVFNQTTKKYKLNDPITYINHEYSFGNLDSKIEASGELNYPTVSETDTFSLMHISKKQYLSSISNNLLGTITFLV